MSTSAAQAQAQCQCQGGTLYAWGDNSCGQLGDGTDVQRDLPMPVMLNGEPFSGVTSIAAGTTFTMIVQDGEIWTWGDNTSGQLGDGTELPRNLPVQVMLNGAFFSGVSAVAAGGSSSFAIDTSGQLWAWGSNSSGQLGTGSSGNWRMTPQQVVFGVGDVKAVASGRNYCLAIQSDGQIWAWGNNANGQLGDGTHVSCAWPEQVTLGNGDPLGGVSAVAVGNAYSVAICGADGEVWSWGNNTNGQLGIGTSGGESCEPVQVQVMQSGELVPFLGVTSIAAEGNATLAVKDGQVWGWGENFGETPAELFADELTDIVEVAIGFRLDGETGQDDYSYFALSADGTLYAWGDNFFGQLGLGTTDAMILEPQEVGDGFVTIAISGTHVLAIRDVSGGMMHAPEPGSLCLLTLGITNLLTRRRKK
ncbi:MAG: hypothetical protein FWD61_16590 [Phycisphaerales bacterium]|nr:hypothetical protein [Phycisphaerales bacterium]